MNNSLEYYIEVINSENQYLIDNFDSGYNVFNKYLLVLTDKSVIHLIISPKDNKLIGYFSLVASAILFANNDKLLSIPSIEIKTFALDKAYQGKNIGNEVFSFVQMKVREYAFECVGAELMLLYSVPNEKVIKFYENNGFSKLPTSAKYYMDTFNDGCVPMWKLFD